MKFLLLACLVASATAAYTWDSCGTKLDRLKTQKVSVAGALKAGSKVSVTATGATDLHVPLDSGAWQVRIYELGEAKGVHTEVGDLMSALKFLDAKNTTFEMKVSFTLPAKKASGNFSANVVATDQAKADYLCLDVKYAYAADLEALTAPPALTCLHNVDTEDHKCFEACSLEGKTFQSKGLQTAGACPSSYNFVEKTKVVTQCPDGFTNLRYCTTTALNVTMKTKGEAGVTSFTEAIVGGVAHCTKNSDCPSSYCQNGVCHACGDECCLTDKDCPGSYCANDPTKMPPYTCHGPTKKVLFVSFVAPPASFCLHSVDTIDHKCFEYCQLDGKTFASKGVTAKGGCPSTYNTVDKTKTERQCPDGVTNLRYCATTAVDVEVKTKGQAGILSLAEAAATDGFVHMIEHSPGDHCLEVHYPGGADSPFWKAESWKYSAPLRPLWKQGKCDYSKWTSTDSKTENYDGYTAHKNAPYSPVEFKKYGYAQVEMMVEDNSAYCMNDKSKHKPFYCHCPPLPTNCKKQSDCVNPWYKSYCMNDASKKAPYFCKQVMPPACKADKDCAR